MIKHMARIYLYVSAEDYAEVKASGAHWDDDAKSWYVDQDSASAFSRWLGGDESDAPFTLTSDEAFVASAQTTCAHCDQTIEVICLYCDSGVDSEIGEPISQFTVSNLWAMDDALAKQLERWPYFRQGSGVESECFANYCPHCSVVQEDHLLHAEPGQPFFSLSRDRPGSVEFIPLEGRIQLSGDYGFEI